MANNGIFADYDYFKIVTEVMEARGYLIGDFEQHAADISVDHPHVIRDYRAARKIALANERGEANTEDLRQADDVSTEDLRLTLQRYRSFFHRLLSV